MNLITTDGYPAYEEAILNAYGETVTPPRTGKRGRPKAPYKVAPQGLTYAVVEKTREKGRVVKIATRVVFGTMAAVAAALGTVERESGGQYVVRRAAERHGPAPQRPEGSQDVSIQQGLAVSRGGDLSVDVHLQFLLAGSDATHQRRARMLAESKPGHGGRVDGSCVVDPRMADAPRRATLIGHEVYSAMVLEKLPLDESVWRLLHFTMEGHWLEDLWTRNRGALLPARLDLQHLGSPDCRGLASTRWQRQAGLRAVQEAEVLPVSITSTYAKLSHLPLTLSEARCSPKAPRG